MATMPTTMPSATLDGRQMHTWEGFHRESRQVLGFPGFYGNNLDAWIDAMSGLRDGDGMTRFALAPGEMLHLVVAHAADMKKAAPAILDALQEAVAEVNLRCTEAGQAPPLALQLR
jgi:hypothetical protein